MRKPLLAQSRHPYLGPANVLLGSESGLNIALASCVNRVA